MNRELIGIRYSPWTEKARWALDHHGLPYRYSEHQLLFGEPALRFKLGRVLKGGVTVPALIEGRERIMDSFNIALHVDREGAAKKLLPEARLEEIRAFNALSERALEAGRAMVMERVRRDPEAQKANLPPFIPRAARPVFRPLVAVGLAYLNLGFHVSRNPAEHYEREMTEVVRALAQALAQANAKNGGDYLLGEFSYADIAMAVALQPIRPVADEFIKLEPAMRRTWLHESLSRDYAALLDWRDRIYRKHRKAG